MTAPATELWWVSIGGNDCEPARILRTRLTYQSEDHPGRVEVFTIGCADGTEVTPDSGIELVSRIETTWGVPLTPKQRVEKDAAWKAKREAELAQGIRHSYRRFP